MSVTANDVSVSVFALGSSLSIREAAQLRVGLLAAIEAGPVVLDASQVERADSAGCQLLVSLARSLAIRGETLTYSGVSATLTEVARTLGLTQACGLSLVDELAHDA